MYIYRTDRISRTYTAGITSRTGISYTTCIRVRVWNFTAVKSSYGQTAAASAFPIRVGLVPTAEIVRYGPTGLSLRHRPKYIRDPDRRRPVVSPSFSSVRRVFYPACPPATIFFFFSIRLIFYYFFLPTRGSFRVVRTLRFFFFSIPSLALEPTREHTPYSVRGSRQIRLSVQD